MLGQIRVAPEADDGVVADHPVARAVSVDATRVTGRAGAGVALHLLAAGRGELEVGAGDLAAVRVDAVVMVVDLDGLLARVEQAHAVDARAVGGRLVRGDVNGVKPRALDRDLGHGHAARAPDVDEATARGVVAAVQHHRARVAALAPKGDVVVLDPERGAGEVVGPILEQDGGPARSARDRGYDVVVGSDLDDVAARCGQRIAGRARERPAGSATAGPSGRRAASGAGPSRAAHPSGGLAGAGSTRVTGAIASAGDEGTQQHQARASHPHPETVR